MSDATKLIVADIGNSALKIAEVNLGDHGAIHLSPRLQMLHGECDLDMLEIWTPSEPRQWCIASVHRGKAKRLTDWLASHRPTHTSRLLSHTDLSLSIDLAEPQKVGIDRLLTAVAANQLRTPHQPAITITAGTAVTVNAINQKGAFLGGAILPSWSLLAKSLHDHTDALPLVTDLSTPVSAIGKNTIAAIRSGLHFGLLGAVKQLLDEFERELGGATDLFIAGGEAKQLRALLGRGRLEPDLVLQGAAIIATSLARSP